MSAVTQPVKPGQPVGINIAIDTRSKRVMVVFDAPVQRVVLDAFEALRMARKLKKAGRKASGSF
jgi:hypothetical protein